MVGSIPALFLLFLSLPKLNRRVRRQMKNVLYYSKVFLKRNSATILTCVGGVGVIATSIMAAKATPKALKRIEEAEKEKEAELTKMEVVKAASKVYLPTIAVGAATIVCIFGANILNKQQQASLASAYALLDNSYREYKRKLVELYGEEAHKNILDSIAAEKAQDTYIHANYLGTGCDLTLEEHSSEPKLFYDEHSNRYFEATIEQVLTAEYHLNRNYILRGYAYLNELYDFLGIEETDYGSVLGWAPLDEGMFWIEFNHHKVTLDDGLEVFIIEMPFAPRYDFFEYD